MVAGFVLWGWCFCGGVKVFLWWYGGGVFLCWFGDVFVVKWLW